ncbi:1-acyl-sn-glycerol-3-phosphate acyltransferase [Antrihabitans stalactiti]|uniref:Acyl-phosphate glycerol 3-phosphate acyltransferase n=1 Tax=Antrihabitans stalactiti TaxID=2584121 RepID=A0A848KK48_9NOCA|nr:1-acyl-sn-glycerol-3-phosphate acyltransferase [Antrihabitans stalactiti]NMN98216.1 acyl-phosphate glycerol 3-phosphate acyltransferase [Antrihabitans stalactiti]
MNRGFRIRRAIARAALRVARWKTVGTVPQKGILVGAPHTSNWDWVATIAMCWSSRVQPTVLIKKEFFKGPFAPLLRATGGVPLDRANPGETIRALLETAKGNESFLLCIAAEGTRTKTEFWKSGFYRISQQTGLPISLGFIDGATKTVGVGPTFTPTGDIGADMNLVREFYSDKLGINPENRTEPRLREESSS